MTNVEVSEFIESEIAARYKTGLNDTQRGDWIRAVWKAGDLEVARAIIRVLVEDPDSTLSIKAFYRCLKARTKKRQIALPPRYDAWVRCLEAPPAHPTWQDREWFRTESFRRSNQASKRYVTEYAAAIAAEIQAREGGHWCGIVKEPDDTQVPPYDPEARTQAEAHILDGPDGPGRRFLLRLRGESKSLVGSLAGTLRMVPREPGEEG
jgi:hypothetical protein